MSSQTSSNGKRPPTDTQVEKMLSALVTAYTRPDQHTHTTFTHLANALSRTVSKSPPWTWRYIHQLHSGNMPLRPRICSAIIKLHKKKTRPRKQMPPSLRITYPDPAQRTKYTRHAALTMDERIQALDNFIRENK